MFEASNFHLSKGGDPMSHGSVKRSDKSVREIGY